MHGDHLGSISVISDRNGQKVGEQQFDPWGKVRAGDVPQTKLDYTGQQRDDTELLYYHARYYDPSLARFISPDSIVPGATSGVGGAGGTVGDWQNSSLTVDFHEAGFVSALQSENSKILTEGFTFQQEKPQDPSGPANPQALNRYSYTLNNPIRYTDPTGHIHELVTRYKDSRGREGVTRRYTFSLRETQNFADYMLYAGVFAPFVGGAAGLIAGAALLLGGPEMLPGAAAVVQAGIYMGGTVSAAALFLGSFLGLATAFGQHLVIIEEQLPGGGVRISIELEDGDATWADSNGGDIIYEEVCKYCGGGGESF